MTARLAINITAVALIALAVFGFQARSDQVAAAPPTVSSISPNMGPLEGTIQVKVQGSGFLCGHSEADPATSVLFGTAAVHYGSKMASGAPLIMLLTDSEILVDVPSRSVAGAVEVAVSTQACGSSARSPDDVFTYQGECVTACSLRVLGTATTGPALRPALGITDGVSGGWNDSQTLDQIVQYMNALHLKRWRANNSPQEAAVYAKLNPKPPLDYVLSNAWITATNGMPPWADGYVKWNKYLAALANLQGFCDQHCVPPPPERVSYWEVWNEPQTQVKTIPSTACDFFDLFRDTYQTLNKLVPDPQVIAPSVTELADYALPGNDGTGSCRGPSSGPPNSTNYISLKNLLDWISTYNSTHSADKRLHFSGYSFHVLNDGGTCEFDNIPGCPSYPLFSPNLVADRVDRLRNLLAEYPDLLPANIEVDEFDSANRSQGNSKPPVISNQLIPGWQVGYIASFEESKVDFAAMGCWHQYFTTDFGWNSYDQCLKGLDGLLIDDNGAPDPNAMDRSVQAQAIYWVYRFYGSMTGTRVRISSPATDLTAFATRDDGRDTMNVLVGRHRRCSVETRRDPSCPAGGPATDVSVQVSWPYTGSSVHYDLQRIPDIGNGLGGPSGLLPSPSGGRVPVQAGVVTVPIPGVNDGDAYTLVLTPG